MALHNLKKSFVNIQPRETAGATSANRVDFQRDVSLDKLLRAELSGEDYVFVFDYHEDLVVMDGEDNPGKVSFYQIKGKKSGNWTLKSLLKAEDGKDGNSLPSILAKLYECKTKFELETINLSFLSNARFNIKMPDENNAMGLELICAVDLNTADRELIKQRLLDQKVISEDAGLSDELIFFEVVDVSVKDSAKHLKGAIAEFFQQKYGISPDVNAIHRMFFAEIKQRGNYDQKISSFAELLDKKAISKSRFTDWLNKIVVANNHNLKEKWNELFAIITRDGATWDILGELKKGWTRFELLGKDPSDKGFKRLVELVENECAMKTMNNGLLEQAVEIYDAVAPKLMPAENDKFTILAIILNKLY